MKHVFTKHARIVSIIAIFLGYFLISILLYKSNQQKQQIVSNQHPKSLEIENLVEGNKTFRQEYFKRNSELFKDLLVKGQSPHIMLIACSDSRVDPAIIFNCKPGELFTMRNIATLVPPHEKTNCYHATSAALEFGVKNLQVDHIILLGHTQCGGIKTLIQQQENIAKNQEDSFIYQWLRIAQPAYEKMIKEYHAEPLEQQQERCQEYALANSLENLKTFPWIQERIKNKTLSLHAWYFDLEMGCIKGYREELGDWVSL